MTHRIWLWMLLVAACGPPAKTTAVTERRSAPAASGNQGNAPVIPCPDGAALAEGAREAWGKDEGTGTAVASCVALRHGGKTLWILDGWFEPEPNDGASFGIWAAVVRPDGELLWREGSDDMSYGALARSYSEDWTAADLDGDGNDEVLYVAVHDHHGHLGTSLMAGVIVEGRLERVEGIPLSRDNSAAVVEDDEIETCDGAWELIPAGDRRQVAITYTGRDCEQPGRHRFAWDGKALVRVP